MGTAILCFMLVEANKVKLYLRRYRSSADEKCASSGLGYHNADVYLETREAVIDPKGYYENPWHEDFKEDPRWPTHCACGYEFREEDPKQVTIDGMYRREDTGEEMGLSEAPPGAMWDAWWMRGKKAPGMPHGTITEGTKQIKWEGPDGLCLMVRLPGGHDWHIDGPASNSDTGWERTGTPPVLVVKPSIAAPGYHGFLGGSDGSRPGYLVEC